jgi:hypothetical protein
MTQFYGVQGGRDPQPGGVLGASRIRIGDREALSVAWLCSAPQGMRFIGFHQTPEGLRLDWESLVGYGDRTWAQLRASRATEKIVVRALARLDDYYNFEFADERRYLSLRLHSPDREDYVNGYLLRDSDDARRVAMVFGSFAGELPGFSQDASDARLLPVTLEVAFPPRAESDRCLRVERLVAPWWLALPEARDQAAVADTEAKASAVSARP